MKKVLLIGEIEDAVVDRLLDFGYEILSSEVDSEEIAGQSFDIVIINEEGILEDVLEIAATCQNLH